MLKKTISAIMLTLLLTSMITLAFNIQPVTAYKSGSSKTHEFIFEQAKTILRNDGYVSYGDFLDSVDPVDPYGRTYLQVMIAGSDDNDKMPYESLNPDQWCTNHYMDPYDHTNAIPLSQKSAGTLCQQRFDEAVTHWESNNYHEAIYDLGWAAHLVQDVCVPHHAWPTALDWHDEYEVWVNINKGLFTVDLGGIYSLTSFGDLQYYTPRHYSGVNTSAYDWVDYNAHESIKYFLSVNSYTGTNITDAANPYIETIHPLPNNLETTWIITTYQTSGMQLHFEKINMEYGFDCIRIYDKYDNLLDTYTGRYDVAFWTPWYNCGDTLKIKVTTDYSIQSWGYKIKEVKYFDTGEDLYGATSVLLSRAQRTTAGFIKFFFDKVLNPIYIRSDGSVDPPTAPIQRNGNVYTFTSNAYQPIVIEKDNIVFNGNGCILQGLYNVSDGFYLSGKNNVTVQNLKIDGFLSGIFTWNSTNITITRNTLENNKKAIRLYNSSNNNTISKNNITEYTRDYVGILVYSSSNNRIVENTITASSPPFTGGSAIALGWASNNKIIENNITAGGEGCGISLYFSSNNTLSKNRIDATHGISISKSNSNTIIGNKIESLYYCVLLYDTLSNIFYHNSIGPSWYQVYCYNSTSRWDDGYPSGGNYWSDYTDVDLFSGPYQNITGSDGIGDTPYVIDVDNQDRYPLIKPWRLADMPYVFVYPENIAAKAGQNITVTVAVSNLTDNVYTTNGEWHIGEPLPPYDRDGIYRYPMGYLVGFDITFSWDPNILEYKNRTVTVPYETYPNPIPPLNFTGTLHSPIQPVKDDLNATLGTYRLAKAHVGLNYFNGNGTLFKMTFRVKKEGGSPLTLSNSKLAAPPNSAWIGKVYDSPGHIPNQVRNGSVSVSYEHDVAVVSVKPSKTVVGLGYDLIMNITVTNEGDYAETFNVTLYANTTAITTQTVTLTSRNSTTITFTWNTTGFAKGNYTLKAYASPVRGETDTADNTLVYGTVIVTIPGDVDGNFEVDIYDITAICICYDSKIGQPLYNPNCDLDGNGIIDIYDVVTACVNYGQKYP